VWLVSNAFLVALGLLIFSYKYLDDLARHRHHLLGIRVFEEGTGFAAAAIVLPAVLWAGRRFRFDGPQWWRVLPVHLGIAVAISVAHTTLMAVSRALLSPLLGMGRYDYGDMRFRYPMEMAQFLILYAMAIAALHLFDYYREARDRQLAAAELESRLARAQLHNLQLQLQPHFLFNVLNTISSVMYEDVRRADAMLAELSELLRATLRQPDVQEVALDEEIATLRLYLHIMQERFGERLACAIELGEDAAQALVPQLLLQPLVENSIRHAAGASGAVAVRVSAARRNGNLILQVSDNGPGIRDLDGGQFRKGIGLTNTAERLAALYGGEHELRLENGRDGGLTVTIRLPYRAAAPRGQ
jgi:two-component system, LytTR family, sensor kinase